MIKLYTYFRSSAAYRVRIVLALKGVAYDPVYIHLLKDGGRQLQPEYRKINPSAVLPSLVVDGHSLGQSMAICEYLDEIYPAPPLLPHDPFDRAYVRQIANIIACDIHPLNNLRVLRRLKKMGVDDMMRDEWYRHWVDEGFAALEQLLQQKSGRYCFGETITLADVFLVPQMFNAERMNCPLEAFPTLIRIVEAARARPEFIAAMPQIQGDFEP